MKRENTVNKKLKNPVKLPGRTVTDIWFDLKHIQHGWDTVTKDYATVPARNNYTEDDIVTLFEQLNVLSQTAQEQTPTRRDIDKRYVFYIYDEGEKLKMVVDLMNNNSTIVVTIY